MQQEKSIILIVDDDPTFLEFFTLKLEVSGFGVAVACNCEEAVAKLKEVKPKLILIDVVMPQVDGIRAFLTLRGQVEAQGCNIAFLTNYIDLYEAGVSVDEEMVKAMSSVPYILKTRDLEKIMEEIQAAMPS